MILYATTQIRHAKKTPFYTKPDVPSQTRPILIRLNIIYIISTKQLFGLISKKIGVFTTGHQQTLPLGYIRDGPYDKLIKLKELKCV